MGKFEVINFTELYYVWNSQLGGRDISVTIARIIKRQLNTSMNNNEFSQLIHIAEKMRQLFL
jgi:hypothetical protein